MLFHFFYLLDVLLGFLKVILVYKFYKDLRAHFEEHNYFLMVHITLGQPIPVGHPAEQANVPQGLVRLGMHLAVLAPPLI